MNCRHTQTKKHRRTGPSTSAVRENTSITPELLTTAEAAELLSIGERTLWRWSRSGICPAPIKIGSGLRPAVRYRRAELLAWLDSGCPRVDQQGGSHR